MKIEIKIEGDLSTTTHVMDYTHAENQGTFEVLKILIASLEKNWTRTIIPTHHDIIPTVSKPEATIETLKEKFNGWWKEKRKQWTMNKALSKIEWQVLLNDYHDGRIEKQEVIAKGIKWSTFSVYLSWYRKNNFIFTSKLKK